MEKNKVTLDDFIGFDSAIEDVVEVANLDEKKPKEIKGDIFDEEDEPSDPVKLDDEGSPIVDLEKAAAIDFDDDDDLDPDFEEVDDIEKPKPSSTGVTPFSKAFTALKEKGLLQSEKDPENDDEALELLEESWENSLDSYVDEMVKDLPKEAKGLINYVKEGGNPYEYLRTLQLNANAPINKDSDITDTGIQETVMRQSLKEQGYDEEYIADHIDSLKTSGKLEQYSKKIYDKIVQEQQQKEENLAKQESEARKQRLAEIKKTKQEVAERVAKLQEVKGFTLTDKDKKELPNYLAEPSVQLANGQSITPLYKDLFLAAQDPEKSVLLAKLLRSDFDFSLIEKKAITRKTQEARKNLQNADNKASQASSARTSRRVIPVWERFDE